MLDKIIEDCGKIGDIEWIYFEGGEPFLYLPIMIYGIERSKKRGFKVGVVSNGYWAVTVEDAIEWLKPLRDLEINEFCLSNDEYHGLKEEVDRVRNGVIAAKKLGIKSVVLSVGKCAEKLLGQYRYETVLMYRGRAAIKLVDKAEKKPWAEFKECPYENLEDPERVHIDPLGYVHVCQGISIGNVERMSLSKIFEAYKPKKHPIIGPLIEGGPARLAESYKIKGDEFYADACHFCYDVRCKLREKFPDILAPTIMYGEGEK
jgi:MoaA/NifB/PqqE/SkfB family radical SAM enzyme